MNGYVVEGELGEKYVDEDVATCDLSVCNISDDSCGFLNELFTIT